MAWNVRRAVPRRLTAFLRRGNICVAHICYMRMIIVVFVFVNAVFEVYEYFVVLYNLARGDLVEFYEKFLRKCNDVGKTPTKVLQELKMPISSNTSWQSGHMPRPSTLLKLADYFGCELDDLKSDETDSADLTSLTTFQRELLLATQGMTPAEQEQLLRYAKFTAAEREKDKAN